MKQLFRIVGFIYSKNKYKYNLLNDKKYAQNIWSKDLVHEKTFWLSSRTQRIPFSVLSRTKDIDIYKYFSFARLKITQVRYIQSRGNNSKLR